MLKLKIKGEVKLSKKDKLKWEKEQKLVTPQKLNKAPVRAPSKIRKEVIRQRYTKIRKGLCDLRCERIEQY